MFCLDHNVYRANENIAKTYINNWRQWAAFNLDHFEKAGFPVRINSNSHLRSLIDTMQENRFDLCMHELGGMSEEDLQLYTDALVENINIQKLLFPNMKQILPLDNMISAFLIYKKMKSLKPSLGNVLEIGPGTGYLSHFLSKDETVISYHQTEACESFYILQNYINCFTFKERFKQELFIENDFSFTNFFEELEDKDRDLLTDIIQVTETDISHDVVCRQYPWWQIDKFFKSGIEYDIVTANSNLLEFSSSSLLMYLKMINKILSPKGHMLSVGSGFTNDYEKDISNLYDKLYDNAIFPQFICNGNLTVPNTKSLLDNLKTCKNIVIAPASQKCVPIITILRSALPDSNILILDDFRTEPFYGYEVVNRQQLVSREVDCAIVLTFNDKLEADLHSFLEASNISVINTEESSFDTRLHLWEAVFTNDISNKLLNNKDNYLSYFNSGNKKITDTFFFSTEGLKKYSKNEIIEIVYKKSASK